MDRPFLTARWENLVLLNYACAAEILDPLVPHGTLLDRWEGEALVSLVGFMFADTRLMGRRVPFHHTFEEVNLRFYVRRVAADGAIRRAVVFVRELVPRRAIATIARRFYNEPYIAVPMSHESSLARENGGSTSYSWSYRGEPFELKATVFGASALPAPGSEAEFITEHYWGYAIQRSGGTVEYRVEHPQWRVWQASGATLQCDARTLYGAEFHECLSGRSSSSFLAEGSAITVNRGGALSPASAP